jgi:hypothetical protein
LKDAPLEMDFKMTGSNVSCGGDLYTSHYRGYAR